MSFESATWATQLDTNNPQSSDPRSQGDDHLRLIKSVMQRELSPANRQWIYTGHAVVRRSTTEFTIAGSDESTTYHLGRRVKVVGSTTGTIYGEVSGQTYSASTAISLTFDSGSMANESLEVYVGSVGADTNTALPAQFRMLDARSYGATGDGSTDDTVALNNFFADLASGGMGYIPKGSYAIGEVSLTGATNISLLASGATFIATGSSSNPALHFASCTSMTVDKIRISNAGGYETGRSRLVTINNGNDLNIGEIHASYTNQHLPADSVGGGLWTLDNDDRCIRIEDTSNSRFGTLKTENADICIRLRDNNQIRLDCIDISSYMKGLRIDGGIDQHIDSCFMRTQTPTFINHLRTNYNDWRTDRPGNNGILVGEGTNVVNVRDLTINNAHIRNSGEHGIRLAGAADAFRVHINNPKIKSAGSAGIKMLSGSASDQYFDSMIVNPIVVDCSVSETVTFDSSSAGYTQVDYAASDNSITLTGGSWPENIAETGAGHNLIIISGSASNNNGGSKMSVKTRDSDTKITINTPGEDATNGYTVVDETDSTPNTVVTLDMENKNSDGVMMHRCRRCKLVNPIIDKEDNALSCLNGVSIFDAIDLEITNPQVRHPQSHGIAFDPSSQDLQRIRIMGGHLVGDNSNSSSGLYLDCDGITVSQVQIEGYPYIEDFNVGVNITGTATAVNEPCIVTATLQSNVIQVQSNDASWMGSFRGKFTNETDFSNGSTWHDDENGAFKSLIGGVWTSLS